MTANNEIKETHEAGLRSRTARLDPQYTVPVENRGTVVVLGGIRFSVTHASFYNVCTVLYRNSFLKEGNDGRRTMGDGRRADDRRRAMGNRRTFTGDWRRKADDGRRRTTADGRRRTMDGGRRKDEDGRRTKKKEDGGRLRFYSLK
uniref:Uncharacterized protein n=1 Tax=Corethron hystrix TaxID=216773 RepID=A0A6U5EPR4_9STRA|mmetsp:Transcript_19199/g.43733  ORF Transcript_19199/g.43733 Transcript_19199/m.43733 type:complete len:146 (+) Transcript_19199:644-1081(+)